MQSDRALHWSVGMIGKLEWVMHGGWPERSFIGRWGPVAQRPSSPRKQQDNIVIQQGDFCLFGTETINELQHAGCRKDVLIMAVDTGANRPACDRRAKVETLSGPDPFQACTIKICWRFKGCSRNYPGGAAIFFRTLHPQDTHRVRAPDPQDT